MIRLRQSLICFWSQFFTGIFEIKPVVSGCFRQAGDVEAIHAAQSGLVEGENAQITVFGEGFVEAAEFFFCDGQALGIGAALQQVFDLYFAFCFL